MAKINTRSPYYISIENPSGSYAILELFIYGGTTPSGTPTYTLRTNTISNASGSTQIAKFEISELIQDYLNPFLNNYQYSFGFDQTVYVDTRLTIYNDAGTNLDQDQTFKNVATMGYGYFSEGANPQLNQALLISNPTILIPAGYLIRLPIDSAATDNITYLYQGNEVVNIEQSPDTQGYRQFRYINGFNVSSSNTDNDWYDYAESNQYTVEDNTLLQSYWNEGGTWQPVDQVIVEGDEGLRKVNVKMVSCDQYQPIKITFENKFGAWQDLWFMGNNQREITTKKETFKGNIMLSEQTAYATDKPTQQILTKNGVEKITLNSGYYPEDNNNLFKELMLSRRVYITLDAVDLPVIVSGSTMKFKTRLTEKLINYTVNFEFAFDTINNIR